MVLKNIRKYHPRRKSYLKSESSVEYLEKLMDSLAVDTNEGKVASILRTLQTIFGDWPVVLDGSRGRGTSIIGSDVDVLLTVPHPSTIFFMRRMVLARLKPRSVQFYRRSMQVTLEGMQVDIVPVIEGKQNLLV